MGILNVTPDSFSDGGRFFDPEIALGFTENGFRLVLFRLGGFVKN